MNNAAPAVNLKTQTIYTSKPKEEEIISNNFPEQADIINNSDCKENDKITQNLTTKKTKEDNTKRQFLHVIIGIIKISFYIADFMLKPYLLHKIRVDTNRIAQKTLDLEGKWKGKNNADLLAGLVTFTGTINGEKAIRYIQTQSVQKFSKYLIKILPYLGCIVNLLYGTYKIYKKERIRGIFEIITALSLFVPKFGLILAVISNIGLIIFDLKANLFRPKQN